jgi:hypothetical protein
MREFLSRMWHSFQLRLVRTARRQVLAGKDSSYLGAVSQSGLRVVFSQLIERSKNSTAIPQRQSCVPGAMRTTRPEQRISICTLPSAAGKISITSICEVSAIFSPTKRSMPSALAFSHKPKYSAPPVLSSLTLTGLRRVTRGSFRRSTPLQASAVELPVVLTICLSLERRWGKAF